MHSCPPDGSAFQPYVNDNRPPLLGFQITKLLVLVEKMIFKLSIMGILSNIYIYIFFFLFFKDNFSTLKGRKTLYSNFALCLHDETHVITYEHIILNSSCTVVLQEINDGATKNCVKVWEILSKSCLLLKDTTTFIQKQL